MLGVLGGWSVYSRGTQTPAGLSSADLGVDAGGGQASMGPPCLPFVSNVASFAFLFPATFRGPV